MNPGGRCNRFGRLELRQARPLGKLLAACSQLNHLCLMASRAPEEAFKTIGHAAADQLTRMGMQSSPVALLNRRFAPVE